MPSVDRAIRTIVVTAGLSLTAYLVGSGSGAVGIAAGGLSFTDITAGVGAGDPTLGGHGTLFADADGNGFPDLYITMNFGPVLAERFLLNGGGIFTESAAARGIADVDFGSHGAVWADLDNDGDYDLVNGTTYRDVEIEGEPNRVYRNNGGAAFSDVTPSAMLARAEGTRAVLAFDMERDGDLDIFSVSGWQGAGDPAGERNEVYFNTGGFQLTPITSGALYEAPAGQGATDTDFDGDGDIDVIAANRDGTINVLRNDGTGGFAAVSAPSIGIVHSAYSGITMGDIDGDDDLDMVLVDLAGSSLDTVGHLYRNLGNGTFAFVRSFSDVDGFMAGLADLDNDGDLDLAFAGDAVVHLNDGSGGFTTGPAVPIGGIDDPRAIAFADIDGDGDLDLAIGAKHSRSWIVRNDLQMGNWLKVKLVSPNGQAGAFGAKVRIFAAGQAASGAPLAMREARSTDGYLSQSDPVQHFGLGSRATVDLVVTFLDGTARTLTGISANQLVVVDGGTLPAPGPPTPTPPAPTPTPTPGPPQACAYALMPTQFAIGAAGGTAQVTVTADSGCAWMAASQTTWISVTAGATGTGPGSVDLRVAQNGDDASRTGSVRIAGLTLVVVQAGTTSAPLDLNADGASDIVRYDRVSGAWTAELGNGAGGFRRVAGNWRPGSDVHAGSLDGDGFSDILLYDIVSGELVSALNDGLGGFRLESSFVEAGWRVQVADLDDDRLSDLVLYDPTTGRSATGRSRVGGGFDFVRGVWPIGWEAHLADLNGDGRDDVFLYDPVSGQWYQLISDGRGGFHYAGTSVPTTQPPPPGSTGFGPRDAIVTPGDFDGDGRDDLLFYEPASGEWVLARNRGPTFTLDRGVWSSGWVPRAGDFDGDGRSDVLIYEVETGRWVQAISDGSGGFGLTSGEASVGLTFELVDFDGDGRDDVLAYDAVTGQWLQGINGGAGQFALTAGEWEPGLTLVVR